jgi:hypothetical protein
MVLGKNMKIKIKKQELENLYFVEKKSFKGIAETYKCSSTTILNRFKEFNLIPRTVSQSLKGRTIYWKDKISNSLTGEKRPGIGGRGKGCLAWNKGLTKYSNPDKIKYGIKKENHWNWKGGISDYNIIERQSSRYKEWRNKIFKRDDYTCQECGQIGGILNAHHIKPFSLYPELRYKMKNGTTLCEKCHKKYKGVL